jgi:SAM-dependent methyltransferase
VSYGIQPDYRPRLEPPLYSDGVLPPRWGPVWQPDVYLLAAKLAARTRAPSLIDVGCGGGHKLVAAAHRRRTIGIDVGENLEGCRLRWPDRDWRHCDLEQVDSLPVAPEELQNAVVVAADVIEHLVNPERLVDALVASLADARFVVLSTPDRDRLYEVGHLGPPSNPRHVREWTRTELAIYLAERGTPAGVIGWTRENDHVHSYRTILAVLAGSEAALAAAGLLGPKQQPVGPVLRAARPPAPLTRLAHGVGAARGSGIRWARRLRYVIRQRGR